MREFDHSVAIAATPARVLDAFFNEADLSAWWHVSRSLCHARSFGNYAVEWPPTEWADDVLGRWGGAFRGTVIDFKPGKEFFIADAYWLPPDGDPIGPMAFEVSCTTLGERMVLRVRQSGGEPNRRWTRYYEVLASRLTASMDELKQFVESGA
jgi:uncharacterized protein YndB with AHSA1/START domain